jgi:hypothetical protein
MSQMCCTVAAGSACGCLYLLAMHMHHLSPDLADQGQGPCWRPGIMGLVQPIPTEFAAYAAGPEITLKKSPSVKVQDASIPHKIS